MTINVGDWKGLIAPAVGGIVAVRAYLLAFRSTDDVEQGRRH